MRYSVAVLFSLFFALPVFGGGVFIPGAQPHGVFSASTAINTLSGIVATVGSSTALASVHGTISYGDPVTVPSMLMLDLSQGMIDCENTMDAAVIAGAIIAPYEKQIFVNCPSNTLKITNGGTVSVKWFGATGKGISADDVLPIQYATDAIGWGGGGTVYFPAGSYNFGSVHSTNGPGRSLFVSWDNLIWEGAPGSILTSPTGLLPGGTVIQGGGPVKSVSPGTRSTRNDTQLWYVFNNATAYYNLTGTQTRGSRTITLATAGDVSNFAVGDDIFIRTGQCIAARTTEPDAEINIVTAIDAGLGTLTLKWPLAKSYAQEYFVSGTVGETSTTPTANPAVYGVAPVTDRTTKNFTLRNLRFQGPTDAIFFRFDQMVNTKLENNLYESGAGLWTGNDARQGVFIGNVDHHTSTVLDTLFLGFGATGYTDTVVMGNIFTGSGFIHIHEGSAQHKIVNNVVASEFVTGSVNSVVSIRSRAYDVEITGNTFIADNATSRILIDAVTGGGIIANNVIGGPNGTNAVLMNGTIGQWNILGNLLLSGLVIPQGSSGTGLNTGPLGQLDSSVGGNYLSRMTTDGFRLGKNVGFGWSSAVNPVTAEADTQISRAAPGEFSWTAVLQSNLGTPANGTFAFCSDCVIASLCAGGGTGALAKRLNNVWVCN